MQLINSIIVKQNFYLKSQSIKLIENKILFKSNHKINLFTVKHNK